MHLEYWTLNPRDLKRIDFQQRFYRSQDSQANKKDPLVLLPGLCALN